MIVQGEDKHLYVVDCLAQLNAQGQINFPVHECFVLAIGGLVNNGPSWRTHLVHQEYFFHPQVITARTKHTLLPLANIILGGRNGSLVSSVTLLRAEYGQTLAKGFNY